MSDLALKFRRCFASQLHDTATDGTIAEDLYDFVRSLVSSWSLSTQAVEGVNNSLKHVVGLSSGISWQSLAARITSKMSLRLGSGEWTAADVRNYAQSCADEWESMKAWIHQIPPQRWEPVSAKHFPPSRRPLASMD